MFTIIIIIHYYYYYLGILRCQNTVLSPKTPIADCVLLIL